jgi:histidinol-phosphate aminotransferase
MDGMPTRSFAALACDGVRGLTPYQPGKPIAELAREFGLAEADIIKLASNENPLGIGARARAVARASLDECARYPDGAGFALKQALAAHHDLSPDCITLGNGSNDVLDLVARAFLAPGVNAVYSEHAFAVYPIAVQAVGAEGRVAPARDYGHDLAALRARTDAATRVVFIANPNNPTGTWLRDGELEAFIADLPPGTFVVVDEAYFEYVAEQDYPDSSRWLARYPHLIVTRTFSKAYGLAGLRVGYALSHPEVADLLNRVREPFNVNHVAQAAACAALEDHAHLRDSVALNAEGMRTLRAGVQALGFGFIPSAGNFLCVDVGRDAGAVYQALLREGVIVRPVANYGLPNHLRVTIGLPEENRRFLAALEGACRAPQ